MEERFRELSDLIQSLKGEISNLTCTISSQNGTILQLTAEVAMLKSVLLKTGADIPTYTKRFPLTSEQNLIQLEKDISEDNKEAMIVSLKKLIIPGGWSKNMERLIAIEVILMYNVDGKNNKKSLKIYPKFLNLLYEATLVEGKTFKDFLNDLRHGLRCVKNKHFKKVCLENKEK